MFFISNLPPLICAFLPAMEACPLHRLKPLLLSTTVPVSVPLFTPCGALPEFTQPVSIIISTRANEKNKYLRCIMHFLPIGVSAYPGWLCRSQHTFFACWLLGILFDAD